MTDQLHDDEVTIDDGLVRRLVDSQLPTLAGRPLTRVRPGGTSNVLYRCGEDVVIRLPRTQEATFQAAKELVWLPRLAPGLPLPIPVPLAAGEPGEGYPWPWSVYRWLPGSPATSGAYGGEVRTAQLLGEFVLALQRADASDGPPPGEHNFHRGEPLVTRDDDVRASLSELSGVVDTAATARAWDQALDAGTWDRAPVWIHGDLHAGNLLVTDRVISGVLDFGGLAVGDPACDLMVAWTFLRGRAREVFRAAVGCDDASWVRGRGWALSMAVIALPYYLPRDPPFAAQARDWLDEVLTDR